MIFQSLRNRFRKVVENGIVQAYSEIHARHGLHDHILRHIIIKENAPYKDMSPKPYRVIHEEIAPDGWHVYIEECQIDKART